MEHQQHALNRLGRVVLVVATVAGLAWLFLHQSTVEQVVVVEPRSAPVLAAEVVAPTMDAPREAAAAAPAPHDGEQFMSDFWGAEWPRIEKELRKQDGWADYDMKKLPKLMPIEEALPHIRSRLMWSPAKRQGVFTM